MTPTFYAPDELPHYKFVAFVGERGRLPEVVHGMDSHENDYEFYQPPLYYVLTAQVYRLAKGLSVSEFVVVRCLRLCSVALWGLALVFVLRFVDALDPGDKTLGLWAVVFVSLLPAYAFVSSAVNNDNLLMFVGAVVLARAARPAGAARDSLLLGVLLGLALLTKLTGAILAVFVGGVWLFRVARREADALYAARRLALTGLSAATLFGPWLWRNWLLYGSLTGEELVNISYQWTSAWRAARYVLFRTAETFWAVSGVSNNVRSFYPFVGELVGILGAAGLLMLLWRRREEAAAHVGRNQAVWWAMGLALLINVVVAVRFGVLHGQAQGRFLFPSLLPISLFLGLGGSAFRFSRSAAFQAHLVGFFLTYAFSFTGYSLGAFARIAAGP
jgi:4-amino-4-deoxy-L-arabinose transferase-like glycosyltransferase